MQDTRISAKYFNCEITPEKDCSCEVISAQSYRSIFHICVSTASLTTQAIRLIFFFQWMLCLTINLYKEKKKSLACNTEDGQQTMTLTEPEGNLSDS